MKIVFICGSLEHGKDGVGDYTRRLAATLIKQGCKVLMISLRDNNVQQFTPTSPNCGDEFVPILRLPAIMDSTTGFAKIKECISVFNPDLISLQYVPFAFHPKGLPFGLARSLNKLGKGVRWHIMVHELWVGMDQEASLKFIYWGWLQKQLIKSLLKKLKPAVIHTHSHLYIKMLEKIGLKANHLPLFGNIPFVSNSIDSNLANGKTHSNTSISFVVFGSIHHGAPIDIFANEARLYKISSGVNVVLKMIGRCGAEQVHWEKAWKEAGLTIELLGEQPPEFISQILGNASFGIGTTPSSLIEKSGAVAAMREHGLTVLCIARPWHPRGFTEIPLPQGIIQYKEGALKEFITTHSQKNNFANISDIARQMTNSLQLAL